MARAWRREVRGSRCLVTGASSGLGRAIATRLALAGARVILTGRDAGRLNAAVEAIRARGVPAEMLLTVAADLTDPNDRARLVDEVGRGFGGALDILVQSAGVGATGHLETHDESVIRRVFEIDVFALTEMARLALPLLMKGEHACMINLGSVVARRGIPGRPEYSAAKFAVAGFTEAVRAEWSKYDIHVMLFNPGFTATEFESNLVADTAVYPVTHRRTMTPEAVADALIRAVIRKRNEVTLTTSGRLLLLVNRLLPRFVDWGFRRWTYRLFPESPAALARRRRRRKA